MSKINWKKISPNMIFGKDRRKVISSRLGEFSLKEQFKRFVKLLKPQKTKHCGIRMEDLVNAESRIGAGVFGDVPTLHRREFFYHEDNVWVWYEKSEELGFTQEMTVRYAVRENGVFLQKVGGKSHRLEGEELENFLQATRVYLWLIRKKLY